VKIIKAIKKQKGVLIDTRVTLFFGIFALKFINDIVYSKYVSTVFRYRGFISDLNIERYILSWIILLLFSLIIINIHKKIKFSSVIITIMAYLSIVPFTTMVAYYPFPIKYIFENTLYWLAIFTFYNLLPGIRITQIKNNKVTNMVINVIVLLFFFVILFISWRYTGFRLTLNFFSVYDMRNDASNFKLPTLISYIYSASKAVNPILMVYFLNKNKRKYAILIFIIQIFSFSINGSKTVLFSTFLAVIIYWIYDKKYLYKIPWLLAIMGILGSIEMLINKVSLLITFIIRRVFFVPNLLSYYYYDFFSENEADFFRGSFLRHLGFDSPYDRIDNLIGAVYYNSPDTGANNGLISDVYANLGIVGLLIMPLLIVLALKFLDACAEGIDIRIFVVSAITMSFIFISSSFFTVLLTHGFIAVCFILYLLPRSTEKDNR
jgi:hypothetical protein